MYLLEKKDTLQNAAVSGLSHENQNRFCRLEFRKGNGLHGDDSNGGSGQRCRRVQTKQSTISLLQSYKLLVS